MKNIVIILLMTITLFSCSKSKHVSNQQDYVSFLNDNFYKNKKQQIESEIQFWKSKLSNDSTNFIFLQKYAQSLIAQFGIAGNVDVLPKADSLLFAASKRVNNTDASIFYKLAQNAITQHKFKEAKEFVIEGINKGGNAYTNNALLFDVNMELGEYTSAYDNLTFLKTDTTNFNYLIRASKYADYLGNTTATLKYMETAFDKVMKTNNANLQSWVCTNLADMYGHNNSINKAYHLYIKALQIDEVNVHALKGIAAIAFNHDINTAAGKNIYSFIMQQHKMPDLYLDMADILFYEKSTNEGLALQNQFIKVVESNDNYGNMYNLYKINLYTNELNQPQKALEIANIEMENRATPETYAWLAFSHFKNNNNVLAHQIYKNHVYNKTFEPNQALIGYQIFKYSNTQIADNCKATCNESAFELGKNNMKLFN